VRPKPTLTRALAAALTTAAFAAPAAPAQPADLHASETRNAAASLPGPPSWPKHPQPITAAATPAGPPTWPKHPQPITNAPAETGDGTAWSTIALGLAGAGLFAGAAGIAGRSRRRTSRSRAAS
jgi:hypothetical protein